MAAGISSSAQGTADFSTLNNSTAAPTTYGSFSTTAGWSVTNSCVIEVTSQNVQAALQDPKAWEGVTPCLNGNKNKTTPKIGTITSPTLKGGISELSFKYALAFSDTKAGASIEIKQNNNVVKTLTFKDENITAGGTGSFSEKNLNIDGDFQIVITNSCPNNKTKNGDRLAIYDLTWKGYTAGGDDPDPEPELKAYWYKFDSEGDANWEAPLVWAWNDGGNLVEGSWPGTTRMRETSEPNIYIIDFDDEPTGIQFIAKDQSKAGNGNINNPVNHATYKSDASAVDEEGNPVGGPKDVTVYFDNRDTKWAVVACYLESSSSWPGAALSTAEGKNHIYQVTFKDTEGFIIFNNNNNGIQTDNISDYIDGHIYKWAAGTDGKSHEDLGVYDPANFPEGDDPEPEVDHWYLVGEATGWALDESMELTAVDGSENAFSITLPSLAGEWKIWNGAWGNAGGKAFGPGSETSAASGVAIDAWCNGLSNDNFNFPIKPDTEVTIILTIPEGAAESSASVAAQLVVNYTAAEETLLIPEKLGVLSTPWFTGNNAVTEMAYDEATNTFSIDDYEVGEDVPAANALADEPATQKDGYVQFGVNTEATSWEELNQAHRYGAETDGTALEFSGDMAEADVKHFAANPGMCNAFKLAPGKYDLAVKFNPEDKSIKLTAKVTPTGVENVSIDADNEADAEYFNLQGVKVAEPSNGIFIRRANGKTTKVFVK